MKLYKLLWIIFWACLPCFVLAQSELVASNFQDAKNLLKRAYQLELAQKNEESLRYYRAALNFFASNLTHSKYTLAIHFNMGNILLAQKQYNAALQQFQKGLQLAEQIGHEAQKARFCQCLVTTYQQLAQLYQEKAKDGPSIEGLDFEVRVLALQITSDTKAPLTPKIIATQVETQESFELKAGGYIFPGKYQFQIEVPGFELVTFSDTVAAIKDPYTIQRQLTTAARAIELNITGEFPVGEKIDVEGVLIQGKSARESTWKPGQYEISIQQPGYMPLKDTITIPTGPGPFLLERVLVTKPRLIQDIKISYDIQPPSQLGPYKVAIATIDQPTEEKVIKTGDLLKPNCYLVRVYQEAYNTVEQKKYIWPSEGPVSFEFELQAKERLIEINIEHDVKPMFLAQWSYSLIAEVPSSRYDPKKVKPGVYFFEIHQPGYFFGPRQKIYIEPSEKPYVIAAKLIAKPRAFAFEVMNESDGKIVPVHQLTLNGKEIRPQETFASGQEAQVVYKFKQYKSVAKKIRILPGEGPICEKMPLIPLKRYEMKVRKNYEMLDGIYYAYTFIADDQEVEDLHIEKEHGKDPVTYHLWLDPKTSAIRIYGGYLYTKRTLAQLETTINRLTNIDINKLIEHLDRKSKGREGRRESLNIAERLVRNSSFQNMIKQCSVTEIEQLIQNMHSWDLLDAQDYDRMRDLCDILETLKTP